MRAVCILLIAGLAGCGVQADPNICEAITEPPEMPPQESRDHMLERRRIAAEACVHRWAYRLARSNEAAPIVAQAVEERCETEITTGLMLVTPPVASRLEREGTPYDRAWKEAEAQGRDSYAALSMMRVVQARAGNCRG